jgi:protein CpxP
MGGNYKRAMYIALPLLLAGAIGVIALPRALAWHHHHHVQSSAELSEHLQGGLEHLLDKVDATDAQRAQADAIALRRAPELYTVLHEGREVRQQLKQALLADAVDVAKVQSVRARLDALSKQASEIGLASLTELAQVLTPEQRQALSERLARFER